MSAQSLRQLDAQTIENRDGLLSAYVEAAEAIPEVESIFAQDCLDGLRIQTVHQGSLDRIGDALFEAEGQAIDRFPEVPVDFRVLQHGAVDVESLRQTSRPVYVRE